MNNPDTFEQSTGRVDWTWKPDARFNARFQKVSHVGIELSGNGAASQELEVYLVDGEDAANDFKIRVGSGTLQNRTERLVEFQASLLVKKGQSLQILYENGNDRAVKAMIVAFTD